MNWIKPYIKVTVELIVIYAICSILVSQEDLKVTIAYMVGLSALIKAYRNEGK